MSEAAVGPLIYAATNLVLIPLILKWFDKRFDKKLEYLRYDLGVQAEQFRHELQKRVQDFGLFSGRRHEAYASVYKSLLNADGSVRNLVGGIEFTPTFEDADRDDFDEFLSGRKIYKGQHRRLLELWDNNPEEAVQEAIVYLQKLKPQEANQKCTVSKNTIIEASIYMTSVVEEAAWAWQEHLHKMLAPALFGRDPGEKLLPLKKESDQFRERLRNLMKTELAGVGPYEAAPTVS